MFVRKSLAVHLSALALLTASGFASAGGCESYPYSVGINIEDVRGGTKIVATAAAGVSFDDIDAIGDAREEATMEAKAMIAKFMNESIKSDSAISKAVNETKSMSGESKQATRTELVNRVKTLRNSAGAVLRGAVPLGDCYTKGREVRVTVGIKPETTAAAGNLSRNIAGAGSGGNSGSASSANSSQGGSGSASRPLQGMDGYSNTKRLDNF